MYSYRLAPELVMWRQELLHTCMQDLLGGNPDIITSPSLLAFLDPAYVTCPVVHTTVSTPTHPSPPRSSHQPDHQMSSSRHKNHGSRIRLLTDLPVSFTDKEQMLRQQSQCAECSQSLPLLGISWLGRTSAKVSVYTNACNVTCVCS